MDVGPLFADLDAGSERYLSFSFALEARTPMGEPAPLAAGQSLVLDLRDDMGNNAAPILASFNAETGMWEALPGSCVRTGPGHLQCTLSALSPMFGLFEPGSSPYLGAPGAGPEPRSSGNEIRDQQYKTARARMAGRLNEIDQLIGQGNNVNLLLDPELQASLKDLAAKARAFAAANRNEQGKKKLMMVAQSAMLFGPDLLAQDLMSEATKIAEEIANKLLSEGDCGRVREMRHSMEQLMVMGGDVSLIDRLNSKIDQLYRDCDLWVGTVRFESFNSLTHPGLSNLALKTGGSWVEIHEIKMATHAETQVLKGEDRVTLMFPEVVFADSSAECKRSISFFGDPSTDDSAVDTDGDGDTDAEELANMTNPLDPGDLFRIIAFTPAAGFEPVSNPVFDVTWSSFPGLSYSLESSASPAFVGAPMTGPFTWEGFTYSATVELPAGRGFVRARRD